MHFPTRFKRIERVTADHVEPVREPVTLINGTIVDPNAPAYKFPEGVDAWLAKLPNWTERGKFKEDLCTTGGMRYFITRSGSVWEWFIGPDGQRRYRTKPEPEENAERIRTIKRRRRANRASKARYRAMVDTGMKRCKDGTWE